MAIYFFLFVRVVKRHPNDIALLRSEGNGKRNNLLLTPVMVAALFAPMPYKAIGLGVVLPLIAYLGWAQSKRLARAGASSVYLRQMATASCVAFVAILAIAGSSILAAGH